MPIKLRGHHNKQLKGLLKKKGVTSYEVAKILGTTKEGCHQLLCNPYLLKLWQVYLIAAQVNLPAIELLCIIFDKEYIKGIVPPKERVKKIRDNANNILNSL